MKSGMAFLSLKILLKKSKKTGAKLTSEYPQINCFLHKEFFLKTLSFYNAKKILNKLTKSSLNNQDQIFLKTTN